MTDTIDQVEAAMLEEWDRFQVKLPELIASPMKDQWAVFAGGDVVSTHPSEDEAFEAAVARFGTDATFIVAQIAKQNPALVLFRS